MSDEGWAWLYNARKTHYFVDGRSLCGRWGYLGWDFSQGGDDDPDTCATCRKKLAKRKEKAAFANG